MALKRHYYLTPPCTIVILIILIIVVGLSLVRSIAISVCVCMSAHISQKPRPNFTKFSAVPEHWPWFSPLLAAMLCCANCSSGFEDVVSGSAVHCGLY